MPSVRTIVADLNSGAIVGIGAKPDSNLTTTDSVVSGTHRIKFENLNIQVVISPSNRISCQRANSIEVNGTYLHYKADWSTITKLDIVRPILVSGNFSGCAFKIYKSGSSIICAHIARPSGIGANANLMLMDDYAIQKGWTILQQIDTVGHIGNRGCSEVIIVAQLITPRNIDSILLEVNSMGLIVGRNLYHTRF